MKLWNLVLIVLAAATIVACGESEPTFTKTQLVDAQAIAAKQAAESEAAKADQKLANAKKEMKDWGGSTARTGKFLLTKNCEVIPFGFEKTVAKKNFPLSAEAMYTEACTSEVLAMKRERDQVASRAKAAEQKRLAAVKQKQQKLAQSKKKPAVKQAKYSGTR